MKELNFEKALKDLETTVEKLEQGEDPDNGGNEDLPF
jgi:exonuclease VII small subunit